ncbi:hypothetical protein KR018_011242 [Drosophila ironensis]|nr:hypothetical protein KR018_011242 [Drosophila ironensis]
MSLEKALEECRIDFDRRVLVTDLLEEYKLTYKQVNDALEAYIKTQEPRTKFEKRFLVHGKRKSVENSRASAAQDELYTVVLESKLPEWLEKLNEAQTQLYSVEVAGGSKSPASIFRPLQHPEVKLAKIEPRAGLSNGLPKSAALGNGFKSEGVKRESATSVKPDPSKASVKAENGKHSPESKKTSPKEQVANGKAGAPKKGSINSFFSAASAANKSEKKEVKQEKKEVNSKPAGTMDSFFKKQPAGAKKSPPEAKKSPPEAKKPAKETEASASKKSNTSMQLFEEEEEESSDEEEKLDKLRRKVVGSEGEESDQEKPSASKRRRISDSDDEEQPPKKTAEEEAVVNVEDDAMDTEPANETYLDDEGFVITQRKAVKAQPAKPKATPRKSSPAKAPAPKKKSPPSGPKGKDAPKTKQAGIMNFFSKK